MMKSKADIKKTQLTNFAKLMNPTEQKPLSSETGKLLGNVNSGLEQINALSTAFEKDPKLFTRSKLEETGQQVDLMRDDLVDILGRLRSGGAINEDEFKSFTKQVPLRGAIAGRIEKPETVKLKLRKLNKLFSDIKSKVEPVDSGLSQRVQAALAAGYSQEEIMNSLAKKGVI